MSANPYDRNRPVAFTGEDARRVGSITRHVERRPRNSPPQRARFPIGGGGGAMLRLATTGGSGIGPASGGVPASASITFADDGTTGTGRNPWPEAIPPATLILVGPFSGGDWIYITSYCPP
jgi:hypothetical protein